jgi:putative endonuclease
VQRVDVSADDRTHPVKHYYVYIMASLSKTLYVGFTSDLVRRTYEHKHGLVPGFTSRYNVHRLVYVEQFTEVRAAVAREKQIKGWTRAKKIALIESVNPGWADLGETLAPTEPDPSHSVRMTAKDRVEYAGRTVAMSEADRRAVEKVRA